MGLKVFHYVYNGPPFSTGYTIRTQSILKAQREAGIFADAGISVKSLFGNYFKKINYLPKNVHNGINYYSAHNELTNDTVFKISSKFLLKENRITKKLREDLYSIRRKKFFRIIINIFHMN